MNCSSLPGRDERGIILPMTLMILVVLVTLVSAMLALGTTEPQIAANLVRGAQALSLAEAGADRTIAFLNADPTCVTVAQNSDYGSSSPAIYTFPSQCSTGKVTLYNADTLGTASMGTYTVTYAPVSYATVVIESKGTTTSGIQRVVRVVVTKQWASRFGILANSVYLPGHGSVTGNQGAIHGNSLTDLSGSDYVSQTGTSASGTCVSCQTSHTGDPGDSGPDKPEVPIPVVIPADYIKRATIIFGDSSNPSVTLTNPDGTTTTVNATAIPASCPSPLTATTPGQGGNPDTTASVAYVPDNFILNTVQVTYGPFGSTTTVAACTLTYAGGSGGGLSGWSMVSQGNWNLSGGSATPPNGLYYATHEIQTAANTNPTFQATLVAGTTANTGIIQINGSGTFSPYYNGLQMVAGDIELHGSMTMSGTIVSTNSGTSALSGSCGGGGTPNVLINGSVTLTGNIVAQGTACVSGTANIVYNVPVRTRLLGVNLVVLSWHAISTLD
jgi:Tfp pilus assembly protein PilX